VEYPPIGTITEWHADGSFKWEPPATFFGNTTFKYAIKDGVSGEEAITMVTILVPDTFLISSYIPLESPTPTITCPSAAELQAIADLYIALLKKEEGVLDVELNSITCDWIVSSCSTLNRGGPLYLTSCCLPARASSALKAQTLSRSAHKI